MSGVLLHNLTMFDKGLYCFGTWPRFVDFKYSLVSRYSSRLLPISRGGFRAGADLFDTPSHIIRRSPLAVFQPDSACHGNSVSRTEDRPRPPV